METYDWLLRGGEVIDGTGADRRAAEVAIRGDRIVAVCPPGAFAEAPATRTLDVTGRIVCPGFIDTHTHDDNAVLTNPAMTPKVSQGVTTVIAGNCGISLSPIAFDGPPVPPLNLLGDNEHFRFSSTAAYAAAVEEKRPGVNVAALIGHSTLRLAVMDDVREAATMSEIDAMRALLAEGLTAGAIGFSTGLYYKPAAAADMDEIVALAEPLADAGGVYATHMRNEHDHVVESLEETFATALKANVSVVVSHHKCAGRKNWGRSRETLAVIDEARGRQRIGLDAYPYAAGSTVLDPDWVNEDIRTMISWSTPHPEMNGRDLADVAGDWGVSQRDAAERLAPAGGIFFQTSEEDVQRILAYPPTMIGSDGLPRDAHPHPRLWGTFPRVLGHYARDLGLFPLELAVHKMTGKSAATFGLTDRGVIREGAYADAVVFDPATIIDKATFEDPCQPAAGIDYVFVNGRLSWDSGEQTGAGAGRFLARA